MTVPLTPKSSLGLNGIHLGFFKPFVAAPHVLFFREPEDEHEDQSHDTLQWLQFWLACQGHKPIFCSTVMQPILPISAYQLPN